jgi:hypothetical protein
MSVPRQPSDAQRPTAPPGADPPIIGDELSEGQPNPGADGWTGDQTDPARRPDLPRLQPMPRG